MTFARVTNLSVYQNTFRNVLDAQGQLAKLQRQISSGLKAGNFEELNGQVEQFTFLEARTKQVQRYQQANSIAEARLKTADQSLGQIENLTDDLENLMVLRRNPSFADNVNFAQQARDFMAAVASELNASFEGRYIFGGTATGAPPVPDPNVAPVNSGVPDANYYKGSLQNVNYRVDDNINLDFPVRADAEPFQQLFAAYNLALEGDETDDDDKLQQAVSLIQQAQEGITAQRGKVNSATLNVQRVNDRHKTLELYWKGVTETVSKTDTLAASIQVSNYEAVLQASFQAYSRLTQLKLSDFL
jgi:flagellar hook-associated protein 3 FlgL